MKRSKNEMWLVITKSLRSNLPLSISMMIVIVGAVVTGILPPLVMEKIINQLTGSRQLSAGLIAAYIALLAMTGIFDSGKEALITIFGQKVTHGIRSEMCQKLSRLPASYYVENETGVITSRFVNDVDTVETLFDSGIISMIADSCKIISILIIIFIKSKGLGVMMLVVTPLLMVLTMLVQKRMLRAQVEHRVAVGKANNHIPETIQNIRMIHTFRVEGYMKKKYAKYIEEGYQAVDKSNFYDAIYSPIIITMSAILVSVMMIFSAMGAGMQTFFGMSVGTAVAIISYVSKVFDPLENIGMEIQNIQSAIAGIYRINEFLREPERRSTTVEPVFQKDKPAISFEKVSFGYTKEEEIFHEISFQVEDKENVTLTGRTGVGKSTAFKLILGMYDTWSGDVNIYGVPVKDLSDNARAKMIGYVEQSFCMIPGTIKDQITMKDESITKQQVLRALELVGLKDRINELASGIDTMCSESLFSQGQIQLLSIARAIVYNPPILLLDEITANLDSITENEVLHALKVASSNRTVLSISHRVFEGMEQDEKTRQIQLK